MTMALWLARDLFGDEDAGDRRRETIASGHPHAKASLIPSGEDVARKYAERVLLDRVRTGEVAAFASLSERYSDALWRYAYRLLHTADLADDVVQDVLFDLWQHRERLDNIQNVRAYLFKATRHRAIDMLRHDDTVQRSRSSYDPMLVSGTSQDFQAHTAQSTEIELEMALDRVLAAIPAHRHEILLLRWRQGFSYEEIAEVLGLGVSAVKMQISRATALLRPLLEDTFRNP